MRAWIVSPAYDVAAFSGPALAASALVWLLPGAADVGPLAWLLLVVGVDVGHVWATLWRGPLDPAARRRWGRVMVATPFGVLAAAVALHAASPLWMWRVLAYGAVFHFVRQQVGFVSLYRACEGIGGRGVDARVERALVYALCGLPVLWWHTTLPRPFAWFVDGDFLGGVPGGLLVPAALLTAALAVAHVGLRLRSGRTAWGRDLWVIATGVSWFSAIRLADGDLAFTMVNVIAHGVPYYALVHAVGRARWRSGEGPATPAWFAPAAVAAFVGVPLAAALIEEGLWDGLVWHDHEAVFGAWAPPAGLAWIAAPALVVPQAAHYVLDGVLWRPGRDPELRDALLAAGTR